MEKELWPRFPISQKEQKMKKVASKGGKIFSFPRVVNPGWRRCLQFPGHILHLMWQGTASHSFWFRWPRHSFHYCLLERKNWTHGPESWDKELISSFFWGSVNSPLTTDTVLQETRLVKELSTRTIKITLLCKFAAKKIPLMSFAFSPLISSHFPVKLFGGCARNYAFRYRKRHMEKALRAQRETNKQFSMAPGEIVGRNRPGPTLIPKGKLEKT